MRPPAIAPIGSRLPRMALALLVTGLIVLGGALSDAIAAPAPNAGVTDRDIPDWLSLEAATRLNVGFDVLAPAEVPAPFSGEPEISAYDGYYSLYWVAPGTPPTFLEITGELGGTIPAYSKYDRNVQLEQNAAVSGSPAYHDLTPIYDLIYWQAGNVVYSVESNNLAPDDSLGIANALTVLSAEQTDENGGPADAAIDAPASIAAGDTAQVSVMANAGGTLSVDQGTFGATGEQQIAVSPGDTVDWQAPATDEDVTASFALIDAESGDALAIANTFVIAEGVRQAEATTLALSCPANVAGETRMTFTLSGSGRAIVDATQGSFPSEAPNSAFAIDGSDDNTLIGDVPESGSVDLVWLAPTVESAETVYLFASTEDGNTPGECDILVSPDASDAGVSAGQELGDSSGATETPESIAAAAATEAPAEPTASTKPTRVPKPTRTPKGYDEMIGLPTALPMDDGTGGSDGRTVPSPTPVRTPTPRPTPTFAPTTDDNGMMAQTIGPGGGTLTSPLGITVAIPKGALTDTVTLSIQPVGDSKLPASSNVSLIARSGFGVAIAGPNGVAITAPLKKPAEIRITVDDTTDASARLYRVESDRLVPLTNTRRERNELVVSVTTFDQFVAGVPVATAVAAKRNVLPFALAAVVVLLAMIVMVVLGGMFRPRRQRVIATRRPPRRIVR